MAPLSKISQDNPSADQMFPRSKNFAAFLTKLTTGPVVSLMRLTLRCAVLGPCELALFKHGERSIPFKGGTDGRLDSASSNLKKQGDRATQLTS
jgi:hypothetical protein